MLRPFRRPDPPSHEDVFVDRYPQLLAWARRLTEGDRLAAEDLVHDAFVNFTLSRPNLDAIQNLDGYLFTSLRHLHLANVRRGRRRADTQLPLVEYDSALDALRALSASRAHEELTSICHYVCLRRQSSKAASVLILRFFHGYAPAEIARVLRLPPRAVDTLLSVARRDVRARMDNPRPPALRSAADGSAPRVLAFGTPDALVADVQRAIFESAYGACRSSSEIQHLYAASAPALDADTLAHLVSCRTCLDRINSLLGLTPLAGRHPDDGIGARRGDRRGPGSGGAATGSGGEDCAKTGGDHARDIADRRPAELRIAVNGIVIGGQHVGDSDVSQHLTVQIAERLGFVEVLDERDDRLLLLSVDAAPDGAVDQSAHIELSDRREIEVTVSFASAWPQVTVTYRDPSSAPSLAVVSEPALAPAFEATLEPSFDSPSRMSKPARPSWWRRASGLSAPWPRPVLIALAIIVALALSIGPERAMAAVLRAGQALRSVLTSLVSSADKPDDPRSAPHVSRRDADIALSPMPPAAMPAPSSAPPTLPKGARLGLKVAVLERLDRVDALLGEGLMLADEPNGGLTVRGVVQDAERRREILDALGSLLNDPHVDVHLLSASTSSTSRARRSDSTIFYGVDVAPDDIPIRAAITRRLEMRGEAPASAATLDRTVRSISARVSELSRRAVLHTWAFKRVATQVSEASLAEAASSTAHQDAVQTWYALLEKHARAFGALSDETGAVLAQADLATTAEDLATTAKDVLPVDPPASAVDSPVDSSASAVSIADALMRAGADQDRTIRSLFVAASDQPASDPETSLRELMHQLHVSRSAARAAAQYCTTRITRIPRPQ